MDYAVTVNVILAGQLCTKRPLENGIEIVVSVFGQVGAVMPGVKATPGLGSYSLTNDNRSAENRTCGGGPIPEYAAAESTKVNGVISVDAAVG
jgi:hypothetical protein